MNKIRIIDLLNKIANGENNSINYMKYFNRQDQKYDICLICLANLTYKLDNDIIGLNDEVEILEDTIEEEKKIPENNFNYIYSCEDDHIMVNFENIKTTLKNIIDYLKSKGE